MGGGIEELGTGLGEGLGIGLGEGGGRLYLPGGGDFLGGRSTVFGLIGTFIVVAAASIVSLGLPFSPERPMPRFISPVLLSPQRWLPQLLLPKLAMP